MCTNAPFLATETCDCNKNKPSTKNRFPPLMAGKHPLPTRCSQYEVATNRATFQKREGQPSKQGSATFQTREGQPSKQRKDNLPNKGRATFQTREGQPSNQGNQSFLELCLLKAKNGTHFLTFLDEHGTTPFIRKHW